MSTIFAVSSGRPPAAIAVLRISGPDAMAAATALAGTLPPPRRAGLRELAWRGVMLDRALVLAFPGPVTATGEDLVELHCHGGRAVVAAVEAALAEQPGCRAAEPGEFTRRALTHGRIDLSEAEGLADLLEAESEAERVAALGASEGRISRQVGTWMDAVATLSARVEAAIDYADDIDTDDAEMRAVAEAARELGTEIVAAADQPPVERLRDGVRVVIAGPPNAGKSTLLNLLAEREAAIVSPVAGTTRDRIEAGALRQGRAYTLIDTAGLRDTVDVVEAVGVARAGEAISAADVLVWLGEEAPPSASALWVQPRGDEEGRGVLRPGRALVVRRDEPASVERLWTMIADMAAGLVPRADRLPLKARHIGLCRTAGDSLLTAPLEPLLLAEHLRAARRALASITGVGATEAMLDALFSRFCLGK